MIDALWNYFCSDPDIIIWFDIFRVNQHADVDLDLNDWWSHSFKSLRPPRRATSRCTMTQSSKEQLLKDIISDSHRVDQQDAGHHRRDEERVLQGA